LEAVGAAAPVRAVAVVAVVRGEEGVRAGAVRVVAVRAEAEAEAEVEAGAGAEEEAERETRARAEADTIAAVEA
jgi:hypothetical protein